MTLEQKQAIREIAGGIIDTVAHAGTFGAPGGVMYAALMAHGCSLNQFESIMGGLCRAGILRKDGECYFIASVETAKAKGLAR